MSEILCDKCKKNPATVHIAPIEDGKEAVSALCPECAMKVIFFKTMTSSDSAEDAPSIDQDTSDGILDQLSSLVKTLVAEHAGNDEEDGSANDSDVEHAAHTASNATANAAADDDTEIVRCPECGMSFEDIVDSGIINCKRCFKVYSDQIENGLSKRPDMYRDEDDDSQLPKNSTHQAQTPEYLRLLGLRDELLKSIAKAVEKEDYHKAAAQKKELSKVEKQLTAESRLVRNAVNNIADSAEEVLKSYENFPEPRKNTNAPIWLPLEAKDEPQIILSSFCTFSRNLSGQQLPPFSISRRGNDKQIADMLVAQLRSTPLFRESEIAEDIMKVTGVQRIPHQHHFNYLLRSDKEERDRYIVALNSKTARATALINNIDHLKVTLYGDENDLARTIQLAQEFSAQLMPESAYMHFPDERGGALSRELVYNGCNFSFGVYLFLPALSVCGGPVKIFRACQQLGFALINIPEITCEQAYGHAFYYLQATAQRCENPYRAARELMELAHILEQHELEFRLVLINKHNDCVRFSNDIWRAAALVKKSFLLRSTEVADILALLWIGKEMGCFPTVDKNKIFDIFGRLHISLDFDDSFDYTATGLRYNVDMAERMRLAFCKSDPATDPPHIGEKKPEDETTENSDAE